MNRARRQKVKAVASALEELGCFVLTIREAVAEIISEEQEALDNLPEHIQESERGQQMEEYISGLETVLDDLDEFDTEPITDTLQEIAGERKE